MNNDEIKDSIEAEFKKLRESVETKIRFEGYEFTDIREMRDPLRNRRYWLVPVILSIHE